MNIVRHSLAYGLVLVSLSVVGCQPLVVGDTGTQPTPPSAPTTLTLSQKVSGSLGGGGQTFTATLNVVAGTQYGVSIAIGTSSFIPSGNAIELLITGDPLMERLSLRNDRGGFQTPGLSLTPTNFFTAQSDGRVTFELVNASEGSLPGGVFEIFNLLGVDDTTIRYDLQVDQVDSR